MTTTATRPTTITIPARTPAPPAGMRTLAATLTAASEAVIGLPIEDPRWREVGPLLTAFVDAARRADGRSGSPIEPDATVAAVLRLRDLAHLSLQAHRSGQQVTATAETEMRLRSLQVAAIR